MIIVIMKEFLNFPHEVDVIKTAVIYCKVPFW